MLALVGRGTLTLLKVVEKIPVIDPHFWHFSIPLGPHFITPSFCRKNGLQVSNLIRKIIGPKYGLPFHANCHLTVLNNFVQNFSMFFFYLVDPLFHCSLIFLTPHFYKTWDLIGSNFLLHIGSPYQTFYEVPSGVVAPPIDQVLCVAVIFAHISASNVNKKDPLIKKWMVAICFVKNMRLILWVSFLLKRYYCGKKDYFYLMKIFLDKWNI